MIRLVARDYPPMLVTAGLNDPRVTYWEPAKWVAKLRELKTDDNLLLMKTNMGAGHGGQSGRWNSLKETAEEYAFILWQMGMAGGERRAVNETASLHPHLRGAPRAHRRTRPRQQHRVGAVDSGHGDRALGRGRGGPKTGRRSSGSWCGTRSTIGAT